MPRMLDLFCGRWGWSKAFAARGWECLGVDLKQPNYIPENCSFYQMDILELKNVWYLKNFDFICASSPCEEFSVHGMKHFHPNPKHPENGIRLFNHTRQLCEASGVPYVMENVRAAQQFVGQAVNHCGPFYLWGNAVPPLLHQGIQKGISMGADRFKNIPPGEERRKLRREYPFLSTSSKSEARKKLTAQAAEIPSELANCVADYAERLLEQNLVGEAGERVGGTEG